MNSNVENIHYAKVQRSLTLLQSKLRSWGLTVDVVIIMFTLVVMNPHLFGGSPENLQIFSPGALLAGQWWRLFTHPFVHVTWYHLFLDAGAFFLLYIGLEEKRVSRKLLYILVCCAMSLAAALIFSPEIQSKGLCGLSGIAHGLMAYSGLEIMQMKNNLRLGMFSFLLVVVKSIYEFCSGDVLFSFMHMGLCGTPLAACHLGGVMGGIICFVAIRKMDLGLKYLR